MEERDGLSIDFAVTSAALGGISTAYTYNTFGELASERHTGAGSVLYDVAYTRDKLGRITQRIETVGGVATTYGYVYDTAGRLIQVTKNGAAIAAYAYDQNGNRLGKTDATATTAGTYDAQDRLLTYGSNSYTYTANGELLTKTNPQGTTSYTYDVLGNLTAVALPDGTLIEYVIDGANRRIGKKVNSVLVQGFLYANQLSPIAELDGVGNVVSTFIYGTKANVPDYMVKGGVTYRIISNHLGSPVLVVDQTTGSIAQQITYDEFGNVLADTNPGFIPFAFAGGIYDQHAKLVRFGARDYDPDSGRWTSKDPIRFSGGDTNLYGYVLNDPINFIDPNGLTTISIGAYLGGTFGAIGGGGGLALNLGYSEQCGFSISLTGSAGLGAVAGLGGGVGTSVTVTNALSVNQLLGRSIEGARGGIGPVTVGGVVGQGYQGTSIVVGPGIGPVIPRAGAVVTTTSAVVQYTQNGVSFFK